MEKVDERARLVRILLVEGSRLLADLGIHLGNRALHRLLERGKFCVERVREIVRLPAEKLLERRRPLADALRDVVRLRVDCLLSRADFLGKLFLKLLRAHLDFAQVILRAGIRLLLQPLENLLLKMGCPLRRRAVRILYVRIDFVEKLRALFCRILRGQIEVVRALLVLIEKLRPDGFEAFVVFLREFFRNFRKPVFD